MTITTSDIVILRPQPDDIREAVRYAIKSGVPYTYDRMHKDAWRRVARIARGKVNETLIRQHVESLGISLTTQNKSYREHDRFDFVFNGKQGRVDADIKTFHILTQYVKPPRAPFSTDALLSGVVPGMGNEWHQFFPMLVPQDYSQNKDMYVFAVSVEAEPNWRVVPVLDYPWTAFPDSEAERSLVDPAAVRTRESTGNGLVVTVEWPRDMSGKGNVIHESGGQARQQQLPLTKTTKLTVTNVASFLAIQLDDIAQYYLRQQKQSAIKLVAKQGDTPVVTSQYDVCRFHEVFPRQDFVLYLIGWICGDEFQSIAKPLSADTPCYFYPQQKGTKTANWYVLPGVLSPIATLTEV